MLKTFVEEAAALASIALFVGMIAVWAQLIPQLETSVMPRSGRRLGEKRDGGCNCVPPTWTPRARGITIEGRVGPRGGSRSLKPQ
jgi:hypothetical protein